jgi:hypothetical protein
VPSRSVRPGSTPDPTREFRERFGKLAADPARFNSIMRTSFGSSASPAELEALRKRALAGDFGWMPPVRWATSAQIGAAYGAYDSKANVVYLNESLRSNPKLAAQVYIEEAGHALDARVNRTDTPGDEGEIFRRLMGGEKLSSKQLAAIRSENDHGVMHIGGREIAVENFNPFKKVWKGMKKVGGAVKSAAKSAFKGVKKVGSVLKSAAKSAVGFVAGVARGTWSRVQAVGSFVARNLNPVNLVKTAWGVAKNFVRDVIPTGLNMLIRGYSFMADGIRSVGRAARCIARGDLKGFGKALWDIPKSALHTARAALADAASLVPGLRTVVEPGQKPNVKANDIALAEIANAVGGSRNVPGFSRISVPGIDNVTTDGFHARVYLSNDGKQMVLAFGGTNGDDISDILTNARQALDDVPPQYRMAVKAADLAMAEAKRRGAKLEVTGHSLGGGLAQTAALAVGATAVTFNAAGIGAGVRAMLGARAAQNAGLVTNYVVRGESLDSLDINRRIGAVKYLEPARGGLWDEIKGQFKAPLKRHKMGAVIKALHRAKR